MIGAHFDSWHTSPGATDNICGSSVMLEAMRILKTIDVKPRRTIRIALWGGEEDGINGSREYVKAQFGDPKTGIKSAYNKFSVYFNMDNSKGQFVGINMQANEKVRSIFAEWFKPFTDLGLTTLSIRNTGSTDHIPFDRAGLPGFQFIQDRFGQGSGHTNIDFYETLGAEDLMKNAVIIASFAYQAAMRDEIFPRKTVK
jgi:carboxypeptidase Q